MGQRSCRSTGRAELDDSRRTHCRGNSRRDSGTRQTPSAPRHGISGCGEERTVRPNKIRNINGNETKVRRQGSGYNVVAELGEVVRGRGEGRKRASERARFGGELTPLLRRTAIVASLVPTSAAYFSTVLMVIDYRE